MIMTVNPGFSGQGFIEDVLTKIKQIKNINSKTVISVDGGINDQTIKIAASAGADVFYVGSYFYKGNPKTNLEKLQNIINLK